jgi:hypothetical protein
MKLTERDRIAMLSAVFGTVTSEQHAPIHKSHVAYSEGVSALGETLTALDSQVRAAQGNPGATSAKEQARLGLCAIAVEVIGAVKAYCAVAQEPELLAKVSFSPSTVCAGKVSEIVARCRNVWQAATDNAADLVKYGITPAKLTKLDKAIKAFDKVKVAPRQHRVIKSAATKLIPVLVRSGMSIVSQQLDQLMPQFQEEHPSFYNAYFAARVVVSSRGGKKAKKEGKDATTDATKKAA